MMINGINTENESAEERIPGECSHTEEDGYIELPGRNGFYACMTVIGQIEGHYLLPAEVKTTKYENMIPRLVEIEDRSDIKGLILLLNTVGGDIEAGLAIAEIIAGMSKPTVSLVLGGCHSIGIPLAVAAKKTFIASTASMTVHPVRMNGPVIGVSQTFEYFRNIQERIVSFVCENSYIKADRFRSLMLSSGELVNDVGTLLDGKRAVAEGLIDEVGNITSAFGWLKNNQPSVY